MSLDQRLLDILACPQDKGPLVYHKDADVLVNERKGIAYRIDNDIPVLLADEAITWPPQGDPS